MEIIQFIVRLYLTIKRGEKLAISEMRENVENGKVEK